jgi:hypothetical protein
MLSLSPKWADFFRSQPETGMGYVIATVILRDGRQYPRAAITGGVIGSIDGSAVIPFTENEIAEFVVTHDKAGMRR